MNPIFRWAGSKRQVIKYLKPYWSYSFTRYLEPFSGSAALFFNILPQEAILGDLNTELIKAYRSIKNDPGLTAQCLERLRIGEKHYYAIRAQNPNLLSDYERAARFIYLNKYCFNGLYRTNSKGIFNVPYRKNSKTTNHNDINIYEYSSVLKKTKLINGDFEEILNLCLKGDFVYLDPPYVSDENTFKDYLPNSFRKKDLDRLVNALKLLDKKQIKFVLSYSNCTMIKELSSIWNQSIIKVRRNIAGFVGNRRIEEEVLISNIDIGG